MSNSHQHKFIDENFFFRITKEAYDLGIRKIGLYIQGEPLLNQNIAVYVKYLKEIGYSYIYISTNGILCTLDRIASIISAGLDSIKFSLNGVTRETYCFHQGIDSYDVVRDNIINTYQYCRSNVPHVKIYIFFIETIFNQNEAEKAQEIYAAYCDEFVIRDLVDSPLRDPGIKDLSIPGKCVQSIGNPCFEPFNRISIDVDGFLLSCCSPVYNLSRICDLNKVSLSSAWHSKAFRKFRLKHITDQLAGTICNQCKYNSNEVIQPLIRNSSNLCNGRSRT